MPRAERCVIFNPAAGKQRARQRLGQIARQWRGHVDFLPTTHPGHAVGLARQAALDGYEMVVAAGGDGTAHEVVNGLMLAQRHDVRFSIIPIGSANDYAHSLGLDHAAPPLRRVDVGRVRAPGGREKFFACCLGLGLNGAVTWESRRIKRLQGVALYGLATLRALAYHYRYPTMQVTIDDEPMWETPTLLFTALIGKREGGFVLAPKAEVDDGWLDYVHAGPLSRWEILQFLPRLALFGPPENYPKVRQGRCRRVTIRSPEPLLAHADGEFFCLPEEKIHEIAIDLLPGALAVAAWQ